MDICCQMDQEIPPQCRYSELSQRNRKVEQTDFRNLLGASNIGNEPRSTPKRCLMVIEDKSPNKNLATGKGEITSQNHGFVISKEC